MQAVTELLHTETVGVCAETLDFWLYECALDAAPDMATVCAWQTVLAARGGAFARLAGQCTRWLAEESDA